jgi:predicted site-specific integrase-resolvase
MDEKQFYKVSDVAQIFEVTNFTARKWCREGLIKTIRLPGGEFRISHKALQDFANGKYGDKNVSS